MNKFQDYFSKTISFLFHPLLMPTLGLLLIFQSGSYLSYIPFEGKRIIFSFISIGTLIIPLCFLPFYTYFKIISNVEIDSPSQRILPLFLTCIIYFCTAYLVRRIPIPFINAFILGSSICVLLNTLIVPWWKISSHLIGLGGITGLITGMFLRLGADITIWLVIILLISGITGFARLRLQAHTPAQVYVGYFTGSVVVGLSTALL
jgi:membrane-associated phospholipid phosphatase